MMFYLNVRVTNDGVQAYMYMKYVIDVGLCTLHFTRHYTDILQEILTSLMLFCCKFIKVYMCQNY